MTDVTAIWADATESNHTIGNFTLSELHSEIDATALSVLVDDDLSDLKGIWLFTVSDEIIVYLDQNHSGPNETILDNVITNHVAVEYESEQLQILSGVTNGAGSVTITFPTPYKTPPDIFIQAPTSHLKRYTQGATTVAQTVITARIHTEVNVPLIGLTVVVGATNLAAETIRVLVVNND